MKIPLFVRTSEEKKAACEHIIQYKLSIQIFSKCN